MRIEAKTPDEYFSLTGDREADLRSVDVLIRKTTPDFDRTMVSGAAVSMVGYGIFHYTYASGKEGDWPVIALANQKNYMSLYVCCMTKDGTYIAEANANRLGNVSVGKSCIRFKKLEDLNLAVLEEILGTLQERHAQGEVLYGV